MVELPFPVTLHSGDTLSVEWAEHASGDVELLGFRVVPDPLREAAAIAALRQELAVLPVLHEERDS